MNYAEISQKKKTVFTSISMLIVTLGLCNKYFILRKLSTMIMTNFISFLNMSLMSKLSSGIQRKLNITPKCVSLLCRYHRNQHENKKFRFYRQYVTQEQCLEQHH